VKSRYELQLTPSIKFMLCIDEMRVYSGASQRSAVSAPIGINTSAMLIVCSTPLGMHATQQHSNQTGRVNMKSILVSVATLLVMFSASARAADDTQALIALDKQWGESIVKGDATVSAKLLADKVVSVDENGVMGKQAILADIKPAPAGTRYEPTSYKVTFMDPDTAIMTHGT
jgi:hypothetical protein